MLQGIFGSKSASKILLFLFVNEKAYGAQIQNLLKTPLTPIQKTLRRLEEEGILISHYEGKLHIYQLNPTYPLRSELEQILKKAYTLLPPQEKKEFCFIHKPRLSFLEEFQRDTDRKKELTLFWNRLHEIQHLSFSARSRKEGEIVTKIGKANVSISSPNSTTCIFQEKGHWFEDQLPQTAFNSSFRWTLSLDHSLITLEHLRYGLSRPVFLFHMTVTHPSILESVDPHLCAADTYLGNIKWNKSLIDFHWRIIGPAKNDELVYHYT